MINIIIFSKDRAAQLDLLLQSLKENFQEYSMAKISVLYAASSSEYELGYEKLKETFINVLFFDDLNFGSFKQTLLKSIDQNINLTMFLVDDIVFKDTFSLYDKEVELVLNNENIIATSLRLWKGVEYCYAQDKPSRVPNFVKRNIWDWTMASGDWGYPMSVDGNIYRTKFICEKIEQIEFANPNQLEAGLANNSDRGKAYMSCYVDGSKLFNIPANIVQKTYTNRHGNIATVIELNKKYLDGYHIDFKHWSKYENNMVHMELEYKWSK